MRRSNSGPMMMSVIVLGAVALAACGDLLEVPRLGRGDLVFDPPQTTKILAADGRVIADLHAGEDRTIVSLHEVPRHTRRAVIAIEDRRFFTHDGVDLRAIARAAAENVSNGGIEQGGSTITQQLVKNTLIAPRERTRDTLGRKLDEIALARQLEKRLSKEQILKRYLNTVYFGQGSYGIQTAAETHFGKPAEDLTLAQSATLAGMIKSPSYFDPHAHPKRAKRRRRVVLDQMAGLGFISPERATKASSRPLRAVRPGNDQRYPAAYFIDYVKRLLVFDDRFEMLGKTVRRRWQQLIKGGLRIHTTADLDMQVAAEQAISETLNQQSDPHGALVAIEPDTGYVRAMVGGRNFFARKKNDPFAKLNLAIAGEPDLGRSSAPGTGRQAGSAFKPFALATAIDEGISLSQTYEADSCMDFPEANAGGNWQVCNYEESAFGSVSLLDATINSINVVYAQLILEVGAEDVAETARKMGIRTPLSEVPSAALGTNPVNALGMASAYGTLATNGVHHPPVAITKITHARSGEILFEEDPVSNRALEPATAYLTSSALQRVIEGGTGAAAQIGRPAAGKTGTAQEWRDAWFVGFTPDLVASVWIGYPQGSIEMKTYCAVPDPDICRPTRITVSGGTWPALIWQSFMSQALAGVPSSDFRVPEGAFVTVVVDSRTGCLADDSTPKKYRESESFLIGTEPGGPCEPPEPKKEKEEEKGPSEGRGPPGNRGNDEDD